MSRLRWILLALLIFVFWLAMAGDRPVHAPSRPVQREPVDRVVPAQAAHLVDLREFMPGLIVALRYASDDNFLGQVLYPVDRPLCARGTAVKLDHAQRELVAAGYQLILWDAYRPQSVQEAMWAVLPDTRYIANPAVGSKHSRAAAVDVGLADLAGNRLPMPTDHDHFGPEAAPSWPHHPEDVKRLAAVLSGAMLRAGFTQGTTEWWHFVDSEYAKYPLLDLPLDVVVPLP
jgi:zinc D-Ala-D-Ala dipeptidase